jgi:hypothetical protein
MTWFASSVNETESEKSHYYPFLAVDFDFPSGHLYYWTGIGDLTINGQTYTGVGGTLPNGKMLVNIEGESETTELNPQRRRYTMSGVDPAAVAESDIDDSFGRGVVEYLGFLNPETHTLIDTPEINFEGRHDSIGRSDGETPAIVVNVEHKFAMLDRIDGWRYTHEHQQVFYPSGGDNGYDQVNAIALKKVIWGGKTVDPAVRNPNFTPPPPRGPLP